MDKSRIKQNYVIFKKLGEDSIGINERSVELENQKAKAHKIITTVHPYLSSNEDTWRRIKLLLEGIKKSNITTLYSPDKIIKEKVDILLIYPYKSIRNIEQILIDAANSNVPLNFDLAFSLVLSIADLIDTGSSIVVSGKKSFHGMLTPDNIFIDYEGKIFLKNYGIHQYIKSDAIYMEMVKKYGTWLTPEFLRKESIVPQSDIYHLGYLTYKMLTGKYFTLNQDEDFHKKLANITFTSELPGHDTEIISKIISFFKKTLDPDPEKRFSNIKEFKDFISKNFHIEELSSVTFNLAYFMNSIYSRKAQLEEEALKREMEFEIPKEKEKDYLRKKEADSELVEELLSGIDEKSSRGRNIFLITIAALVLIAVALFVIIPGLTSNKKELEEQQARIERLLSEQQKTLERLSQLQSQTSETQKDKTTQNQEIETLKARLQEQQDMLAENRRIEEQLQKQRRQAAEQEREQTAYGDLIATIQQNIQDNEYDQAASNLAAARKLEMARNEEELSALEKEIENKKSAHQTELAKQKEQEALKQKEMEAKQRVPEPGELVDLKYVSQQPALLEGEAINFPGDLRRKFKDNTYQVSLRLLVDENGDVKKCNILTKDVPFDIQMIITQNMTLRKYQPAVMNGVKVKVWLPVSETYTF